MVSLSIHFRACYFYDRRYNVMLNLDSEVSSHCRPKNAGAINRKSQILWSYKMIKVLITDKLAQEGIDLLNSQDGVEAVVKTGIDEDELSNIIGEHDGLIIRSGTKVTENVLSNPGKLKGIARAGVGVDNINIPEATRKGILVMNTPGGNTLSAAEHTMALILAMSRNVVPACNSLKGGAWDRKKYMGNQLNNKVLGLIGLGRIGMAVARMAKGFNMKILGYDPLAAPPDAEKMGVQICKNLEDIFKQADYISVHVPRNEQTLNMIGAEQIEMMKPSVRLVNSARGGIINEDALYEALASKRIAGAALDVFAREPLSPESELWSLDNVIITPHTSGWTWDYPQMVLDLFCENLKRFLEGKELINPADMEKGY